MAPNNAIKLSEQARASLRGLYECDSTDFNSLVKAARLDPMIDFRYVDLSHSDLSGADLRGFDFSGSNLSCANLAGALVNENTLFKKSNLEGCDFSLLIHEKIGARVSDAWSKSMVRAAKLKNLLRIEEAIKVYLDEALQLVPRQSDADRWRVTLAEVGNSLLYLAENKSDISHAFTAINCFAACLKFRDKHDKGFDLSLVHDALGNAHMMVFGKTWRKKDVDHAIENFELALRARKVEADNADSALLFSNLGNAYFRRGEISSDLSDLRAASNSLLHSLTLDFPDHMIFDKAMVHSNLGNVYSRIAERTNDRQIFIDALQQYDNALNEITYDTKPVDWARVQFNRINCVVSYAAVTSRAELISEHASLIPVVLEVFEERELNSDIALAKDLIDRASQISRGMLSKPLDR